MNDSPLSPDCLECPVCSPGCSAVAGELRPLKLEAMLQARCELLGKPVGLGPREVVGPELDKMVAALKGGQVLLAENVRFNAGETMPDKAKKNPDKKLTPEQQKVHDDFVAAMAKLGEVYVNDAFGTCHRKHASMYGVAKAIQAKGKSLWIPCNTEEIKVYHRELKRNMVFYDCWAPSQKAGEETLKWLAANT